MIAGGVVEALAALGVAGIALAGLALAAGLAFGHVRLAQQRGDALALATTALETLRAGPRTSGADAAAGGFARTWSVVPGRGAPDGLAVRVAWGSRAVVLSTEAQP